MSFLSDSISDAVSRLELLEGPELGFGEGVESFAIFVFPPGFQTREFLGTREGHTRRPSSAPCIPHNVNFHIIDQVSKRRPEGSSTAPTPDGRRRQRARSRSYKKPSRST